jgi:hypothetical protein
MDLQLQLKISAYTNTTKDVRSNPAHCEVYWIHLYVIKFVSDFRHVCGYLGVPRFPPLTKLNATM